MPCLVRPRRGNWQANDQLASLAFSFALDRDAAAVHFDQSLDERQADSQSTL